MSETKERRLVIMLSWKMFDDIKSLSEKTGAPMSEIVRRGISKITEGKI